MDFSCWAPLRPPDLLSPPHPLSTQDTCAKAPAPPQLPFCKFFSKFANFHQNCLLNDGQRHLGWQQCGGGLLLGARGEEQTESLREDEEEEERKPKFKLDIRKAAGKEVWKGTEQRGGGRGNRIAPSIG